MYIFSAIIETNLALAMGVMFLFLVLAGELGYRLGRRHRVTRPVTEGERGNISTLVAGMLTLVAFILGLTISFATSRYETRRDLVKEEANAIGTAWLRAGIVEGPHGEAMVRLIEDYTKVRLAYVTADDGVDVTPLVQRTSALQNEIWAHAREVARTAPNPVSVSLIAALNDMIDLSLSQRFAFASRVPLYLIWAIVLGSLLGIGAMEYQFGISGKRQTLLSLVLLLMWSGAIMLIIDLNRPRLGVLRVDERPLTWTIQGFAPIPPPK